MRMTEPNPAGCPYCGSASGVTRIADTSPKVDAFSCAACGTDWATSVVNPRLYLDHLAGAVELATARSVLRQLIALANSSAALSDAELRERLSVLVSLSSPPERR